MLTSVEDARAPRECQPLLGKHGPPGWPFAALPHDLAADPRLNPTDVRVAAALLYHSRAKDHCWPGDAALARRVGRVAGTVQRALRRLEAAGWIARERSEAVPNGRIIRLCWRAEVSAGAQPPAPPARSPGQSAARNEEDRVVKGDQGKGEAPAVLPGTTRPEPPPTIPAVGLQEALRAIGRPAASESPFRSPSATPGDRLDHPVPNSGKPPLPAPASTTRARADRRADLAVEVQEKATAWLATGDPVLVAEARRLLAPPRPRSGPPREVGELLRRIRESPEFVPAAAELLAQDLDDRKSWRALHAVCQRAWAGEIEPEALESAWRQATSGKARNPGAVFMTVVKREGRSN